MNETRPLALVTGASSGIGAEIALELATRNFDLILLGRDLSRLAEVAEKVRQTGATAETHALDLGSEGAIQDILGIVAARPLSILVNNAGFGMSGDLAVANPRELEDMIGINIKALTLLSRAILPSMLARDSGTIVNVASTAAFSPCPGMAAYGASKAYVLSFSEALAEELSGTGVRVTALCPGATVTRFADRADMGSSRLFRNAMKASDVARIGVRAALKGKRVRVTGILNSLMSFSVRLTPRTVLSKVAAAMFREV